MSAIDTAKVALALLKKGATIEAQEALTQLREEALSLQEENLALRQRVNELETALSHLDELEFDGAVYWRAKDGEREGPFCQRCFDSDRKLIRLQLFESRMSGRTTIRSWDCRDCKSDYKVK